MKNVYCSELSKSVYDEVINTQKQSFTGVLQNSCSSEFLKFHKKTPV